MQGDEALDPRCYAPIGLEPRTRALLTAVPFARRAPARRPLEPPGGGPSGPSRCGRSTASAAGVHAELRLWPESNPEWFQGRLALLCDADLESIAALTLAEQRELLERNLAAALLRRRSSRRRPTGSPTSPTWRARAIAPRCPPICRNRRSRAACRRRSTCPRRRSPTRRSRSSTDAAALRALCAAAGAGRRAGRGHRDRLRPAGRARRLVARRRGGAPAAGGGAGRRRDRLRRRRLLRRRPAAARAPARRRPRDHRPQRALRAGLADVPLRPAGLALRLRHELRLPRLRAPLVDPGSRLRAPRRDALDRDASPAGRAQGRLRRRLVGRRAARGGASSTTRPTTPSHCSSCAIARSTWPRPSAARRRCSPPPARPAWRRSAACHNPTATRARRLSR